MRNASIAQLAEHALGKRTVVGSIPTGVSSMLSAHHMTGRGRYDTMGPRISLGSGLRACFSCFLFGGLCL